MSAARESKSRLFLLITQSDATPVQYPTDLSLFSASSLVSSLPAEYIFISHRDHNSSPMQTSSHDNLLFTRHVRSVELSTLSPGPVATSCYTLTSTTTTTTTVADSNSSGRVIQDHNGTSSDLADFDITVSLRWIVTGSVI